MTSPATPSPRPSRSRARRGEARPFQRADGRWAIRFTYPRDSDGRPSRPPRILYGRDPDEVRAKAAEEAAHVAAATWRPDGSTSLGVVAARWLAAKSPSAPSSVDRPVRASTYERDYAPKVERWILRELGAVAIEQLDSVRVKSWLVWMEREGASPAMRRRCLSLLRTGLIPYAIGERLIASDPTVGVLGPASESRRRRVETSDPDAARILAAIHGHYLAPLYEIALMLGPRSGELRGLTTDNLDFERRLVHLEYTLDWAAGGIPLLEDTKTEAGHRTIRLPDTLWAHLESHLDERAARRAAVLDRGGTWPDTIQVYRSPERRWVEVDLVFRRRNGSPLREDGKGGVGDLFKRRLARAGLPPLRLHDLRHLAVGMLLQVAQPWQVAQIVGHSSHFFSLDRYAPRALELVRQAGEDLEGVWANLMAQGYDADGRRKTAEAASDKVSDKVSDGS